jgi:hypothetical protein
MAVPNVGKNVNVFYQIGKYIYAEDLLSANPYGLNMAVKTFSDQLTS